MSIVGTADNFLGNIACSGTTQNTAYQLYTGVTHFDVVTGASGSNSINLPVRPYLGEDFFIRNDTSVQLNIFPGGVSSTIDENGAGSPYLLDPGHEADFYPASETPTGIIQWYTYGDNGGATGATGAVGSVNIVNYGQTGTLSATGTVGLMMGLGNNFSITPSNHGKMVVNVSGDISNNTSSQGGNVSLYYGTGSAPNYGSAITGINFYPGSIGYQLSANGGGYVPFNIGGYVPNLVKGTPYWFDLSLNTSASGTISSISNINMIGQEF
jgi:hypothetical protein